MEKRFIVSIFCIALCLLVNSTFAHAQDIQLPRISIDELKAMLDRKSEVLILDTQPEKLFQRGHIKGARSFPFKRQPDWSDAQKLPDDKPIVLYCDCGPGEADSNYMGLKLKEMGFLDVKVLAAPSIRGWIEKGYPVEQ
ncbi:rhodanese-like domain-containing protein [Thermodesulfobacteriota bacterium]